MPNNLKALLFVLLTGLLFASCHQLFMDKRAKLMLNGEKGLFRGLELDMTLPEVRKIATDSIDEEDENFLGYVLPGLDKSERLELDYSFNEQGKLDLIVANYYLAKDEDAEHMIAELKQFFDKKVGASKQDEKGWQVWQYRDKKGLPGDVEIVLNKTVSEKGKNVDLEIVKYYDSEQNSTRTPTKK